MILKFISITLMLYFNFNFNKIIYYYSIILNKYAIYFK